MTEERRCKTCRLSKFNNGTGKACVFSCSCGPNFDKWQPIAQCKYGMNNCQFLGDEDTCAICAETGFGLSEFLPNKRPIAQEKPNNTNLCNSCESMCYSGAVIKCADYKSKDKPMENKVIFESEEECAEFLCNVYNHNKEYCLRSLVPMAKQAGYIRKSAVEEADYIRDNNTRDEIYSDTRLIDIIIDGYDDLKSEIARLKK